MEFWLLSLYILFFGTIFLFLSKNKNNHLILSILWLPAVIGLIYPACMVIKNGTSYDSMTNISFWGQNVAGIIDPLSAFFLLSISIVCLIYLLNKVDKIRLNLSNPLVIICLNILLLAIVVGVGTANGFYLLISILFINLIFQIIHSSDMKAIDSAVKTNIHSILSYISIGCFIIILILSALPEISLDYSSIMHSLTSNGAKYRNDVYMLVLIGTCIPIFCSCRGFFYKNMLKNDNCPEFVLMDNIICATFLYILARYVGMGAIPTDTLGIYISLIIISIIALFVLIALIKNSSIAQNHRNYIVVLKILSIFSLMSASLGYLFSIPAISILGITAFLGFFVNALALDMMISLELGKYDNEDNAIKNSKFKKLYAVEILSSVGIPSTIGFLGWISLFGALSLGVYLDNSGLRLFSVISLLIVTSIYAVMLHKSFKIFKSNYSDQIEIGQNFKLPKFNGINSVISPLICVFIFLSGILLEYTCRVLFCPVSYMVGGTKFIGFFKLLENYARYYSFVVIALISALLIYVVLKIILLKYLQKK